MDSTSIPFFYLLEAIFICFHRVPTEWYNLLRWNLTSIVGSKICAAMGSSTWTTSSGPGIGPDRSCLERSVSRNLPPVEPRYRDDYYLILFILLCPSPLHCACHEVLCHTYVSTNTTHRRFKSRGTVVVDNPYRWLEQDSIERRAWALGLLFLTYQKLRSVLILLSSRSVFYDISPPIFWMESIGHSCQK